MSRNTAESTDFKLRSTQQFVIRLRHQQSGDAQRLLFSFLQNALRQLLGELFLFGTQNRLRHGNLLRGKIRTNFEPPAVAAKKPAIIHPLSSCSPACGHQPTNRLLFHLGSSHRASMPKRSREQKLPDPNVPAFNIIQAIAAF
jgi:hypothetical protein